VAENNVHGIKGEFRRLTTSEVGLMIRLARKQQGLKRAALAADVHISEKTLERAESGRGVSEESSRRIARALGFQEDAFVAELYIPTEDEVEQMQKNQEEEIKATYQPLPVVEIKGVRDVMPLFQCELFFIDGQNVAEKDQEIIASLQDSLRDWIDVYSDVTELERVRGAQSFIDEIHAFEALGYVVKSGADKRSWRGMTVSVAVLTAFKKPKNGTSTNIPAEVWLPKNISFEF